MLSRRLLVGASQSRRFFSGKSRHVMDSAIAELNKEMEAVFGEPAPTGFVGSSKSHQTCEDNQITPSDIHENIGGLNHENVMVELNKEMEAIFGEPAPTGFSGSSNRHQTSEDTHISPSETHESVNRLTHVGHKGEAQMVDVSPKDNTKRTAIASCKVMLGKKVFDLVAANQLAKGDVLSVAKIAGISGAKQTATLIPLCHNIGLSHVRVDLGLNPEEYSVQIEGEATTTGKTGVEMEALTAVTVAGLTVYDMCKAASKDIEITDVRLQKKTGGKSGDWSRLQHHQDD